MSVMSVTTQQSVHVYSDSLHKLNYFDWLANKCLLSANKNSESWSSEQLKPYIGDIKMFLKDFTRCSEEESALFDSLDDAFTLEEEYVDYLARDTPIMNNGGRYLFQIMLWFVSGIVTEKRYQLLQQVPFRKIICRVWAVDLCVFQNVNKLGTTVTEKKCPSCEKMHDMFKKVITFPSDLESEIDQIIQRKKPTVPQNIGTAKVIPGGFEISIDSTTRTVIRECSIECSRKNCQNTHPEGWNFKNNVMCISYDTCRNSECVYKHEADWNPAQNLIDYNNSLIDHRSTIPCNFKGKCNKKDTCPYDHTQVARVARSPQVQQIRQAHRDQQYPRTSQAFIVEKPNKKKPKRQYYKRSINTSYNEEFPMLQSVNK